MTIKKAVLTELGGFDPNFGMTGNKIGYGEETEFQIRMRKAGYTIGLNKAIQIDHLVAKYKLSVWWHLRAAWKNQIASTSLGANKKQYPFWLTLKRIIVASIKRLRFAKNLTKKNYYWQNFVFDYSEPIIRLCASVYAIHVSSKRKA